MNDRRLSLGALLLTCMLAMAGTATAWSAADIDPNGPLQRATAPVALPAPLANVTGTASGLHW